MTRISNESGEAMFNYGADDEVRIERDVNERALLAFTITAIPVVDAGENDGAIMISTNDDSTRFTTSEGTPSADRPVLTVTFIP